MTTAETILRLSEIEAERARLSDEAQRLIAALAGTRPGEPDAPSPDTPTPAKASQHLVALKRAAGDYGMTDRRMKRWAMKTGALRKLSGRLMVDVSVL